MTRPMFASLALAIFLAVKVQGSGEALITAAKTGDISTVRNLIEEGADLNYKDGFGYNALLWAAREENKDILKILIEAGSDVNVSGPRGWIPKSDIWTPIDWWSPLMYAAALKDMEMFNLLIAAGADVNYQNDDGETALFRAVEFPFMDGTEDMVRALIHAGADVNAKYPYTKGDEIIFGDHKGWTPLMLAISAGHNGVSQLLIDAGSDLSYRNPEGETALLMATRYVSHGDPAELVQSLVDAGADVNVSAQWNRMTFTPLMHAALANEKEVAKILIAAGAETGNIRPGGNIWKQEIDEFLTSLEQE